MIRLDNQYLISHDDLMNNCEINDQHKLEQ